MVVINNVRQQNEDRVSYLIKLDARNVYEISHPANRAITQKSTCDTVYVTGGGGGYVIILKHSWESASYATRLQYFSPILEPPPTLEPLKV